jgi:uncharacterized protein DUF998
VSKNSTITAPIEVDRIHRSHGQKLLLAAGFAGVLFIGTFVVLGALAPNYNSAREAISALEFTSLSVGQRLNFLVFGFLLCAFALALRRELHPGRGSVAVPFFQALSGIAVIGDAIFIHFPLHLVCDLIAFLSTLTVLFLFAWLFRQDARWKGWSMYSAATGILMMLLLGLFGYMNHAGGPAGLMEKAVTLVRTLWSVLFVTKLLAGSPLNFGYASAAK